MNCLSAHVNRIVTGIFQKTKLLHRDRNNAYVTFCARNDLTKGGITTYHSKSVNSYKRVCRGVQ
jgi:ribosomal protein S8E